MSKALNLTDMLWNRNDGAGQERLKEAGSAQGAQRASAKRARTDFVPEQPAPPAPGADKGGSVKSFQERVKESQDRLSRKGHAFFKQAAAPKQPGREDMAQGEARKSRDASQTARPERTEAPQSRGEARAAARKSGSKACEAGAPAGTGREDSAEGMQGIRPEATDHEPMRRIAEVREDAGGEADPVKEDDLESRLEAIGLEATPEQLEDPAFLAEMLWQIDGLPMALPLLPDSLPAAGEAGPEAADGLAGALDGLASLEAPAVDGDVDADLSIAGKLAEEAAPGISGGIADSADAAALAGNAAPVGLPAEDPLPAEATGTASAQPGADRSDAAASAETFDWTAVDEPEREEIAALVREKLALIAEKPELRSGPESPRAGVPDLPAAVQWTRTGAEKPQAAAAPGADPVLADPDRLRVLQNSGLEDALSREHALLALERDLEADTEGAEGEESGTGIDGAAMDAARPSSEKETQDSPADLFGRQGGAEARGEASGSREAQVAHREAGVTPFQSAMESARVSEARLARAKQPVPQAHAPMEPNVLAQIARKLSALGSRSAEEIRIQLEPEHLGKVRIALELRGEGLTARISVENDSVRQMVDQNLASLKESLENQGVKIQGMEVSVEQRHASLFNPDGQSAREFFHRRGAGAGEASGTEATGEAAAESDTGRRMGYNTMEYIA